ncbi:sensor histidine kinase [Micromonospora sp. 050-3]|uniref:sensor histidine kinase n=1 Tax=Micromonospora sp. 050-3 TaxID=2789265 RepID=UPI00397A8AEA
MWEAGEVVGERRSGTWWLRFRLPLGVAVGIATAAVELAFLVVAAAASSVRAVAPTAGRQVAGLTDRYGSRLVLMEHRRLAGLLAAEDLPAPNAVATRRQIGYLAARLLPGTLALLAYAVLGVGVVLAGIVLRAAVRGELTLPDALTQIAVGAVLLLLNVQAVASIAALDIRLARRLLGPGSRAELTRRVHELTISRAGVIAAVDAERQRIERDLHDGLQQRLVALGMLLGRARRARDADRTHALLVQAHEDVQRAIEELREVAWRVYPSALDDSDLGEVLAIVARGSEVPVRIRCELPVRPERQVETVLYFVACEALTNAAKHAAATLVTVDIGVRDGWIRMRVHDDGVGGAEPTGRGLSGLARRVAALDGRLLVTSPAGGPTTVLAQLPCD